MVVSKYEIDKFSGNEDFTLWSKKITTILIHQKSHHGLEDPKKLPKSLTEKKGEKYSHMTSRTIILNISDNVLMQAIDEPTTYDTWRKLQSLYVKKHFPNKSS